ncbi:MAG: gamma-glutamylcyclotransferase family protein [Acidimicrobiales bacterium]
MTDHLATYGTLMPGEENHWVVRGIAGRWSAGAVRGWTYPIGFGPADGYPGLTLDPSGDAGELVPVAVLSSDQLDRHWRAIDDFEGPGYRRVRTSVELDDGTTLTAWIYETDPEAE